MLHVLILGAGFGGLELATRLSASLGDEVYITLVDQHDAFIFGFSKLEILFGRQTREEVRYPYRDISRRGVEFRQEQVTAIDPQTRHVVTDGGTYEPDILVVALGAVTTLPPRRALWRTVTSTTPSPAQSACMRSWHRSPAGGC